MRKTLWTLALCGFASTASLQAQDRTLAPAGAARSSSNAPRLKNYSEELFGAEPAAAQDSKQSEEPAPVEAVKPAGTKLAPPAIDAEVAAVPDATEEAAPEGRVTLTRTLAPRTTPGQVPVARGAAAPKKAAPVAKAPPAEDGRPAWADLGSEPEIVGAADTQDAPASAELAPPAKDNGITLVKGETVKSQATVNSKAPAPRPAPAAAAPTADKVTTKVPAKTSTITRRVPPAEESVVETEPAEPVVPRGRITTTRQVVRQVSGTSVSQPATDLKGFGAEPTTTVKATSAPVAAPQVVTEWRATGAINIGQEATCELVIKNSGNAPAANIEVAASFPKEIRFVAAEPAPTSSDMVWTLDTLGVGEEQVIRLTFIPEVRGSVTPTASVRFSGLSTGSFSVAEPLLAVKLDGVTDVLVGETASQTLIISNPGTGIVTNVRIEALIPEGLEHVRGSKLKMDLGNLAPGENRPVRLALTAVGGGRQTIEVHATADNGLDEIATTEVTVIAPSLTASIDGPGLRYLGRQATYTLSVVNDGAAATDNVRVMHKVPEGFEFVSAEKGVQYDPQNRMLNWFVGRLDSGAESTVPVVMIAKTAGEFTHFIRATSEHGAISDAEVSTRVEGASSLVVTVSDLDDPVEVGVETAYEIKIKNEGTAAASNVALTCELPAGVTFLKASGPTQHSQDQELVVFGSMDEVAVGQTVTFQVMVKGTLSGNMRFRTRLTSDSLAEPLTAEELTKVYGE